MQPASEDEEVNECFYRVKARFKPETAAALAEKLRNGTIQNQKPDGDEIVKALHRAVLNESGHIEFSIVCYCSTPLAHERATVLDKHFDALTTEVIDGYQEHEGRPFMDYLKECTSLEETSN